MRHETEKFITFDGLDATGKSTLVKMLETTLDASVVKTPPKWMAPLRPRLDKAEVSVRFLYYLIGNLWVDRLILRPLVERGNGNYILQDRSWITTLSAHEMRGLSEQWLNFGLKVGQLSSLPAISYIIHVDSEERRQRLLARGANFVDIENLSFGDRMEKGYIAWGGKLGWNPRIFDNTRLDEKAACADLTSQIINR